MTNPVDMRECGVKMQEYFRCTQESLISAWVRVPGSSLIQCAGLTLLRLEWRAELEGGMILFALPDRSRTTFFAYCFKSWRVVRRRFAQLSRPISRRYPSFTEISRSGAG